MKTAEQVLRDAAEYLRTYGWAKDGYGEHGGPRCMMGALFSVHGAERPTVVNALLAVTGTGIPFFNDHYCRKVRDAIAALEIAADLAAPEWKP